MILGIRNGTARNRVLCVPDHKDPGTWGIVSLPDVHSLPCAKGTELRDPKSKGGMG